jgi:hypothetical protein
MGVTATAAAMKNKLRINAEWRANRRKDSDAFKEAEQMSRDKYNEFTKLSRAFVRAYPNEFKTFLLARSRDTAARQSFGQPRHMLPEGSSTPVSPSILPGSSTPPPIQLPDFTSSVSSGRIPSAQKLESGRLPASHMIDLLGLARD